MGVPLRLLLIEDSEDDAQLIVRQLKRAGYEPSVERVESAATLAAALDRAQWDVVISDYNLPDFNGAVALRQLRDRDADTPFIFVSGTIGEEVAVAAMKAGAQDYVIKGNLRRLGPAVDRELREAQGRRERRRAELALAESERRHRNLFDTVNLIVLGLNERGMVDYASPFFLQLTGYGAEEVFGRDWFEFLPERDRPRMRMAFREVLEFGTGFLSHHENSIMTKAGVERMIAWHNTVLHAADGRANGTLSIGEDITERQSLQAQLIQAQKMEAVGLLAGGIAHDFNNLLGAITMFGELAATDLPPGDPRRQDLDSIQEAVARATTLTRQLLTLGRQQVQRPKLLDPNAVITALTRIVGRIIGEDIELIARLEPAAGLVRADESQLEQVLMNLAVNARDAMPDGGQLTFATTRVHLDETAARVTGLDRSGDFLVLTVTDTGSGIAADVLPRMFEPFFTTKGARGTGLGLATVYGIVRQSGGHIGVTSGIGTGTKFTIHLPSAPGHADQPDAAGAREPDAT